MLNIKNLLLELRLFGMKDAIDRIALETTEHGLSFQESLLLLLEAERLYKRAIKTKNMVRKAHFRSDSRLEKWDQSFDRGITKQQLRELTSLRFHEVKNTLLILGSTGVGKTQLAIALGRQACQNGIKVAFTSTNAFFDEYALAVDVKKTRDWITSMAKIDLLILDDFALRKYTHAEASVLLDVLEEHYQKGSLIVTSQVDPADWHGLFDDPVIAQSIVDRLIHPSIKVVLSGRSYRTRLYPEGDHLFAQEGKKI